MSINKIFNYTHKHAFSPISESIKLHKAKGQTKSNRVVSFQAKAEVRSIEHLALFGYFRDLHSTVEHPRKVRNRLFWEKLVEMAAREKSLKHLQKRVNATFETSSIDSTAVEEKLFGQAVEDEDSDDGPVVFICGKCKLPVGDSVSWDGSEDGENQIRLKRE